MQILNIAGTIGRNAEVRRTQGGDAVAGFSVAVDNGKDREGNKRPATWYDCSLWGKRGEGLASFLTKGSRVAISGRPSAREHEGKIYLQCTVDQISLLGGGNSNNSQGQDYQSPPQVDMDDEIPF